MVKSQNDNNGMVGFLKKLLFKDPFESRQEFFELRHAESFPSKWCGCRDMVCKHYDNITYISKNSRQYFEDMCPLCIMKVEKMQFILGVLFGGDEIAKES